LINVFIFLKEQLASLRQVTLARIMCDNGDDIKSIQLRAFFRSDFQYNLITIFFSNFILYKFIS